MNLFRRIYYFFPPALRRHARRAVCLPLDLYESLTGKRDPMVPPRGRIFIGSGDFIRTGETIRNQLTELAGLQPGHRVLDVGCGMGRVAVPLTRYLDRDGSYEGFDIVRPAIRWCNRRIASRHPNFRFTHIDLRNDLYNLGTDREARDLRFPYSGNEFDLVILTSVFTHMLPDDVDNYLVEIHRILKPGGTCFATFFLMNEETRHCMRQTGREMFKTRLGDHYLFHSRVKEANVAYDETSLFEKMIASKGFAVEQVRYGFWPGRPRTVLDNYQDICVLRKPVRVLQKPAGQSV